MMKVNYKKYQKTRYEKSIRRTQLTDPLLAKIFDLMVFNKQDIVLDYGCGRGDYSFAIKKYVHKSIGVDVEVKLANKKYPHTDFYQQRGFKLKFSDNYFDKIICVNVIEHVDQYEKLLDEFHRVLKNGGKLFITTLDRNHSLRIFFKDDSHIIEWGKKEFEDLIKKHFTVKQKFNYGIFFNLYPLNWFIIKFVKPELCIFAEKD